MAHQIQILAEAKREAERSLGPLDHWYHKCHAASIEVVNDASFPFEARVARGFCEGVGGQHSWIVLGMDCYDKGALIIDPTLWSYDDSVEGIWTGNMRIGRHRPHGSGNIFKYGKPASGDGEPITLDAPEGGWSDEAELFIDLIGPMDETGWRGLANFPVEGWPAAEIIGAIADEWPAVVPIDILGMLTDRNPGGLYLPGGEKV